MNSDRSADPRSADTDSTGDTVARPEIVVGWREWIEIPVLCDHPIKAKIDTGAKTSALHAFELEVYAHHEETWARFEVHPLQRTAKKARVVETEIVDFRPVQSSNGASELRPVIQTDVVLGSMRYDIEVTLTNRDQMGFRMLLGRSALQGRVLVDPSLSFHLGDKSTTWRRR